MPKPTYRILVVDDEAAICDLLSLHFAGMYQVSTATSGGAALDICDKQDFDMVIADINMPGMSGPELLAAVRKAHPATVTVLMTGYDVNDYIDLARRYGFSNIISKTVPFNFPEIDALVHALLSGDIFGLARHLLGDGEMLARYTIRSSAEARAVREQVVGLFMQRFAVSGDMNLLIDEALTNALYHAMPSVSAGRGSRDFPDVLLGEGECIGLEAGHDSQKYGVSVTDNSGRLTRETVLERLSRQISGRGAMDQDGRGMHISRMISDRMIVNISRGRMTEVILMNYFRPHYRGYKPLYINEL